MVDVLYRWMRCAALLRAETSCQSWLCLPLSPVHRVSLRTRGSSLATFAHCSAQMDVAQSLYCRSRIDSGHELSTPHAASDAACAYDVFHRENETCARSTPPATAAAAWFGLVEVVAESRLLAPESQPAIAAKAPWPLRGTATAGSADAPSSWRLRPWSR